MELNWGLAWIALQEAWIALQEVFDRLEFDTFEVGVGDKQAADWWLFEGFLLEGIEEQFLLMVLL